jgi:hypothetical protein
MKLYFAYWCVYFYRPDWRTSSNAELYYYFSFGSLIKLNIYIGPLKGLELSVFSGRVFRSACINYDSVKAVWAVPRRALSSESIRVRYVLLKGVRQFQRIRWWLGCQLIYKSLGIKAIYKFLGMWNKRGGRLY